MIGYRIQKHKLLQESGVNDYHDCDGRPKLFSPSVVKRISHIMAERISEQKIPDSKEFLFICMSTLQEDLDRKGKAEIIQQPCNATMIRL